MKKIGFGILLIFLGGGISAQETTEYASETFKDTRIVNGQSVETNETGQLKFIISHRFGLVSKGVSNFFGLDEATIRLGVDYGVTDRLTIGYGRSSYEKTIDGFFKYKLLKQSTGAREMPVTMTWQSNMAIRTAAFAKNPGEEYDFANRLTYGHQLMIARKFCDDFSAQLMPTFIHRNLVDTRAEKNDLFAIGAATRYQLTKGLSFQAEYYYVLPNQLSSTFTNSLSLGFDIQTKGHVFQLHVSNSQGMIDKFFISETREDFFKGDIFLGFNISRDFQLKGKKYK
jgi:hypothetical protein